MLRAILVIVLNQELFQKHCLPFHLEMIRTHCVVQYGVEQRCSILVSEIYMDRAIMQNAY